MKSKTYSLLALAIVVIAMALLPLLVSGYIISTLILLLMYVSLAQSWNLSSGHTGYVSLGHGMFFGIGAYALAMGTVKLGIPIIAAMVVSVIVTTIVALMFGTILFVKRIKIAYFAIIALALNEIVKTVVLDSQWMGASYGITVPPLPNTLVAYYYLLGVSVVVIAVTYFIRQSDFGLGLKAILADEVAAGTAGVNAARHKIIAYIISAAFPALVAAMMAQYWSYIDPFMAFDLTISFDMVVMTMLGGVGTLWGPVLGAVLLVALKEGLSNVLPQFYMIPYGVLVVLLVIASPGGIAPLTVRIFARISGRAAKRLKKLEQPL